ncbi:MAG: RnfABCDGE type electron transport complex subunit G [Bacteroidales bacterium]|jgi:electron transport complex protein RnfG|nr:RnfABCDGE type electron transport complex subunit G [Bacteroidales bacterium]
MAKLASNFKNILLCLLIISATMAAVLGVVNHITKKPIEKAQADKDEAALKKVLNEYDRLEEIQFPLEGAAQTNIFKKEQKDTLLLYFAYKGNELIGCAVKTFSDKGFGGRIKLVVGFLPNGDIKKIEVLSHTETPGLGDKMEVGKSTFPEQFLGKNPANFKLTVSKDGGDVQAITAATISSRAYCDAVESAYKSFMKLKEEKGEKSNE